MDASAPPEFLGATPDYAVGVSVGPYRVKDYLKLPDDPRAELIEGRFYVSPAPILLHQVVSIRLSGWLLSIADRSGGQAFAAPTDLQLADHTVVQPDLLYYSASRRQPIAERLTAAPDMVIEILSADHSRDRVRKARVYADHGVSEYWIVDPKERLFDFFVLDSSDYKLQRQTDSVYASPHVGEVTIDLARFWDDIDRQVASG